MSMQRNLFAGYYTKEIDVTETEQEVTFSQPLESLEIYSISDSAEDVYFTLGIIDTIPGSTTRGTYKAADVDTTLADSYTFRFVPGQLKNINCLSKSIKLKCKAGETATVVVTGLVRERKHAS